MIFFIRLDTVILVSVSSEIKKYQGYNTDIDIDIGMRYHIDLNRYQYYIRYNIVIAVPAPLLSSQVCNNPKPLMGPGFPKTETNVELNQCTSPHATRGLPRLCKITRLIPFQSDCVVEIIFNSTYWSTVSICATLNGYNSHILLICQLLGV